MKKLPFWVGVMAVLSVLLAVCSFILRFWRSEFSPDPEQWGQVGDYFGGVLNPIFSGLNLLVTIVIAIEVQKLNSKQGKKQIKAQRQILKAELQHDLLRALNQSINSRIDKIAEQIEDEKILNKDIIMRHVHFISIDLTDFEVGAANLFENFNRPKIQNNWKECERLLSDLEKKNIKLDEDIIGSFLGEFRITLSNVVKDLYSEMLSR